MMQNDVVVVGGGISGLSLAFYCVQAGMKTTILEKKRYYRRLLCISSLQCKR